MPIVMRFIEPCLPSPADRPPSGNNWIYEIKHDGYRLMARRDSVGIRLITRRGNAWTQRFPLVVQAVNHLKVHSCLIDGEVVCCDERGLARFDVVVHCYQFERTANELGCLCRVWRRCCSTHNSSPQSRLKVHSAAEDQPQ